MKHDPSYTWDQFFTEVLPSKQEREAVFALLCRYYSSSVLGGSSEPVHGATGHFMPESFGV